MNHYHQNKVALSSTVVDQHKYNRICWSDEKNCLNSKHNPNPNIDIRLLVTI